MPKRVNDGRVVVRLEMSPRAKEALDTFSDKVGMTKLAVSSRLVEWFASQPEEIRHRILSVLQTSTESEAQLQKEILQKIQNRT